MVGIRLSINEYTIKQACQYHKKKNIIKHVKILNQHEYNNEQLQYKNNYI